MSNDNSSIHEHDISLIKDYFSTMQRQGPGSPEVTIKALSFVDNLTDESRIIDVGCGSGGQTMVLAQNAPGMVTGVDVFPEFIDPFNENALKLGLQDRVKGIIGSMMELPFKEEELDLIWSEGAIYFMGFENGLREWSKFLKKGGYVEVTEASWFKEERPDEIHDFWMGAYPGIDTIPNQLAQMQRAGYMPVASFTLPENCWMEHYYDHHDKAQEVFLAKHAGNKAARDFIDYQRYEARLYDKYKEYYGYTFFIGKKL